jgi:hypothetical protein
MRWPRAGQWAAEDDFQDPRKEVIPIRNVFPDRIAMRLDEPEQVNIVLGDGARDRGAAAADLIFNDPATGAGVAYVRLATDPDPHPHELRHSGASLMLAQGTPLHVVSECSGRPASQLLKMCMVTCSKTISGRRRSR